MEFVDTHCHIHFPDYELDPEDVIVNAQNAAVTKLICVGCTLADSDLGIALANKHKNIWASIGLHPHEAKDYVNDDILLQKFRELAKKPKVIAIGECGLDYYYKHSSKDDQKKLLRFQLDMAQEYELPVIFHIRDAFDDFWPLFDSYDGIRGVIHSFTATSRDVDEIIKRGLYIGLNGIMTFTKNQDQLEAAKQIPLNRLLLETDSPYLTPVPFRGTICEPKYVRVVAEFLSNLRGETLEELATATTHNAWQLFSI